MGRLHDAPKPQSTARAASARTTICVESMLCLTSGRSESHSRHITQRTGNRIVGVQADTGAQQSHSATNVQRTLSVQGDLAEAAASVLCSGMAQTSRAVVVITITDIVSIVIIVVNVIVIVAAATAFGSS